MKARHNVIIIEYQDGSTDIIKLKKYHTAAYCFKQAYKRTDASGKKYREINATSEKVAAAYGLI